MPTRRQLLSALAGSVLLTACAPKGNPADFTVTLDPAWEQPAQLFWLTATVTNDTLLLGGTEQDALRIVAHDLATGDVRWRLGDDTTVTAPDVGEAEIQTLGKRAGWTLLNRSGFAAAPVLPLAFWNGRGAGASGVVGLDPVTGKARWGRTLVPKQGGVRVGTVVVAATDSVVVALTCPITTVDRPEFGQDIFGRGPHTAVALDAATGEVLWTLPDTVVRWAHGDTALAFAMPSGAVMMPPPSTMSGLDLRTGKTRWTWDEEVALDTADGDHALLVTADYNDVRLVRLSTGERSPMHEVQHVRPRLLAGEPATLAWGAHEHSDTMTTQVIDEQPVSTDKPSRFTAHTVARGLLWGTLPDLSNPTVVALDHSGTLRSQRIDGGELLHVTEDWLIFLRTGFRVPESYVVVPHRVTGRG